MSAVHHLPEGWKKRSLQQVAEIQTGIAKGKKDIVDPVECPYLRVANVQDGHLDLREVKLIQVARKELARYSLRQGDVLMTEGGDFDKLGRGAVWEGEIPNCLHQNHVFAVRAIRNKLDPYFLSYQTGSSYGKSYFKSCSKQSTNLASINSSQLKEFPVLLPSVKEQESIVEVIQTWDRAIALTEGLITAKQKRRAWLMQQLLTGKRRVPGYGGTWSTVRLGDVFQRVQRSIPDGETPEVLSITSKVGFVSQREKFSKVIAGKNLENYVLIRRGEFSYNKGNSLTYPQGCVFRLKEFDEGAVPSVFFSFRAASTEACPEFYSHFFSSGGLNHQLSRVINSGVRNDGLLNLNASDFFALNLPLPPADEQTKIAGVLTVADRELDLLRANLDALREQKKGLMQQLLTGKVRVVG